MWTAPWRVEIPKGLLKAKDNELEIEVANLWPNRLAGDGTLPKKLRRTWTNILTFEAVLPPPGKFNRAHYSFLGASACPECVDRRQTGRGPSLFPSGLIGPVNKRPMVRTA